jgi:Mn-dependent DtxR family transcriptional regulator
MRCCGQSSDRLCKIFPQKCHHLTMLKKRGTESAESVTRMNKIAHPAYAKSLIYTWKEICMQICHTLSRNRYGKVLSLIV